MKKTMLFLVAFLSATTMYSFDKYVQEFRDIYRTMKVDELTVIHHRISDIIQNRADNEPTIIEYRQINTFDKGIQLLLAEAKIKKDTIAQEMYNNILSQLQPFLNQKKRRLDAIIK